MTAAGRSISLWLVQSGESTWEAEGRVQGAMDLPLSEGGRKSLVHDLAAWAGSPGATVHHPSDEAANETARLCADRITGKTKAVKDLADPHLGLLEGLTQQQFADRFPTRFKQWEDDAISFVPPEGEEIIHAVDRLFRAVARILRRFRDREVVVVLHPLGLGMLRCWLADRPLQEMRSMSLNRPRVERYVVPLELVAELEESISATQHADNSS